MNWALMEIAFLYDFETSENKLSWNYDYIPLNKMYVRGRVFLCKMTPDIFTMKSIPQGFMWILVSSNNQYETIQEGD